MCYEGKYLEEFVVLVTVIIAIIVSIIFQSDIFQTTTTVLLVFIAVNVLKIRSGNWL